MAKALIADTAEAPVEKAGANGTHAAPEVLGSLADILGTDDTQYETVWVPQWSRHVRLASLTGLERNRIAQGIRETRKKRPNITDDELALELQARAIVESMVDADGNHIADQSMAPALMGKNNAAIVTLFLACTRLSGIGDAGVSEAIDDLKGTPSDATGSD